MKFVYGILVFLALVVAALFLVPSFLDWERFKPEIAERLEAMTGRAFAIDGPLKVSILPTPTMEATDLRLANVPGAAGPDMARIKSLDLSLALGPLLGGKIAVTSLELVEPVIELQRPAEGRPNWLFESEPKPASEGSGAEEPESDLALTRLDSMTITNGTVVYRRADGQPAEQIERIHATVSARSLDGPFRGDGKFSVRGREVAFQLATSTVGDDRSLPISLEATIAGEGGRALFEGTVRGNGETPAFEGTVRAEALDFNALLNTLAVDRGSLPAEPLAGEFDLRAALSLSADAIAARELQLRLGEGRAKGTLSWQGGDVPQFGAKIDLNRIDLDLFLRKRGETKPMAAARSGSDAAAEEGAGTGGSGQQGHTGSGQTGDAMTLTPLQTITDDIRRMIPRDIAATVDVRVGTVTWREGVIRQARAQLELADGVVTIGQASALLPGGADVRYAGRLTAAGDGPWMEGIAEIAAEDLRAILAWLGVDVGAVPADRLRRLSASADLSASGNRLSADNLDIRADTTRIAGNLSVETSERARITAALAVDSINMDAYLADAGPVPSHETGDAASSETGEAGDASRETAQTTPGRADEVKPDREADATWPVLDEIDADVALAVDALTYGGVRLAGLELDAALETGNLTLRRAAAADAAGVSVLLTGTGRSLGTAPAFDLAVEGAADSLDGVAALLDVDPDIRTEAFGRTALNGTLAGDRDALSLDLALSAGAAEASLQGTVERPLGEPAVALALNLRAADAAGLARTFGLTPPPIVTRLGALALEGGIGGDLDSVAINAFAEAAGATLQVAGKISNPLASPSYSLGVDIAHPRAEDLVETLAGGVPDDAVLGALRLAGTVSGDRTVTDFANIEAVIGESTLGGGVFLRLDEELPSFSAELHAGVLDLAWLGGGLVAGDETETGAASLTDADPGSTGTDGAGPEPARWSDEGIDFAILDELSGTLALTADALVLGDYRIEQADVDLKASEGTLTLRSLSGRLFDGALNADGSLAGRPVPAGQAAFRLSDADLGAILRAAASDDAVSGRAEVDGYVTLRGQSAHEMVRSLTGRVAISGRDGSIEGVDVPALGGQIDALSKADALDDITSFIDRTEHSLSSGQTAIRSLDGTVWVQDGQARIDGFEIVVDGGVGDIEGTADLPAWQLDLTALFRLTEHPDAPPVGVQLEGSIDRPERRYQTKKMQAHLVKIGLLSLAGAPDMPKITLRKGAKAEPGTEMDTLLRDVLGDPDKAEDNGQAEAPEEPEAEIEADETAGAEEADGGESPAPSVGEASDGAAIAAEPAAAEAVEEPADAEASDEGDDPLQASGEGERAASPSHEEPVPRPPPAPKRKRDEELRDFVDDLLKTLEE